MMRLTPSQLRTTTPHPPVTTVRCDPTTPKTPSNSAVSWNVDACTILPQPRMTFGSWCRHWLLSKIGRAHV